MNFNRAADNGQTTTARELANELGSFTRELKNSASALQTEISNIEAAKTEIHEELKDTIKSFVVNTLSDLNGAEFDIIASLAENVPELGGHGIAYYRKKMIEERDAALQTANEIMSQTVDAADFQSVISTASEAVKSAKKDWKFVKEQADATYRELAEFRQSEKYSYVKLAETIASHGSKPLSQDNSDYYTPTNIFTAIIKWCTEDANYRAVRKALVKYGHGEDGKDFFADIAGFEGTSLVLEDAYESNQKLLKAQEDAVRQANDTLEKFSGIASRVKTDDQILEAIQLKVVNYLMTPEFIKVTSGQFAEDFPRNISLMTAKLETLDKLQNGAEGKLNELNDNILKVTQQYNRVNKMKSYAEVRVDLDQMRQQHSARRMHYDNYARATGESWSRTRSYEPPASVVYVDNSPSFFQTMLMYDMLTSHRSYDVMHDRSSFASSPLSPYTAGMMGMDRQSADAYGVPDSVFTSPEVEQQMADMGIDNYHAGNFSFTADESNVGSGNDFSFDAVIDTAIEETKSHGSYEREEPSWSRNDTSSGYSSPSFSGGSNS